MTDEIVNNIEFKPIIVGSIISIIIILIGMSVGGIFFLFGPILGSAIAGYLTENSTMYALIYGAIIGIICSFFVLTVFTIPLFIILGLFGAFIGKIIQANLTI